MRFKWVTPQSNLHIRALAKFYDDGIKVLKKEVKQGQKKRIESSIELLKNWKKNLISLCET